MHGEGYTILKNFASYEMDVMEGMTSLPLLSFFANESVKEFHDAVDNNFPLEEELQLEANQKPWSAIVDECKGTMDEKVRNKGM